MAFHEVPIESLEFNPFKKISKQWMLITAGDEKKSNTMTASWGGLGIMWGKNVATAYIRPNRYTKEFVDAASHLSLTFFDESYRKQLSYLGRVSGRDEDKIKNAELHVAYKNNIPYFEEANTVILGRKLYMQEMKEENFLDKEILAKNYPNMDLHTMYVIEIEEVFTHQQ